MRSRYSATALVLALALAGCSTATLDRGAGAGASLTIGAPQDFTERVIAQLYGQALAADGFAIDYNGGVTNRADLLESMQAGRIDVVPELLGDMLQTIQPGTAPGGVDATATALESALEGDDIRVLDPSEAQIAPVFVVASDYASEHRIDDLSDLANVDDLAIVSRESIETESYGRQALEDAYGVSGWSELSASTVDEQLVDLHRGLAQVAVLSTTDAELYSDEVTVLDDPRTIIAPQNIVALVREPVATLEVGRVIGEVDKRLTSRDLARFASRSEELPETVAHEWLVQQGLLSGLD
jgi:osmoprotectant transport system substrate-binding protein